MVIFDSATAICEPMQFLRSGTGVLVDSYNLYDKKNSLLLLDMILRSLQNFHNSFVDYKYFCKDSQAWVRKQLECKVESDGTLFSNPHESDGAL